MVTLYIEILKLGLSHSKATFLSILLNIYNLYNLYIFAFHPHAGRETDLMELGHHYDVVSLTIKKCPFRACF